jgi:hypothetical protein
MTVLRGTVSELAQILGNYSASSAIKVELIPDAFEVSDAELMINSALTAVFDPDLALKCKRITIKDCGVTLENLNLCGMLLVDQAFVTLRKCRLHHPSDWADYLLVAKGGCKITLSDCVFEDSRKGAIVAEDGSAIVCHDSIFRRLGLLPTSITSNSSFEAHQCVYDECESDCITLDSGASAIFTKCRFLRSRGRAIDSGERCELEMRSCQVSQCDKGLLYGWHCDRILITRCEITDCDYSAIFLDHSEATVEHTRIIRCNGNAVNCAHSKNVVVSDCQIHETTFPPICVCEDSESVVRSCEILDSRMCGAVIRTG